MPTEENKALARPWFEQLVEQTDATAHLPGETVLGYHCVAPT
jgi:hypothetical protein